MKCPHCAHHATEINKRKGLPYHHCVYCGHEFIDDGISMAKENLLFARRQKL